jgi:hypothetical protein
MKFAAGKTLIQNGTLVDGAGKPGKLADVLVVDGHVLADISILVDRSRLIAVMQGGDIKAGRIAPRHEATILDVG